MPAQFKSFELDKRYAFDYLQQGNQTLVVTIGDSWTWGHGLANMSWDGERCVEETSEKNLRLEQVYGALVAKNINADFINLSYPGQSNGWIATYFNLFVDWCQTQKQYKKIHVVICMSEVAREWLGEFDVPVDYYDFCKDIFSIEDFLKKQSKKIANEIMKTQAKIEDNRLPIEVIKGVAFVEDNYPKGFITCDKTWQECIFDYANIPYKKNRTYLFQTAVIEKLEWLLEYNHYYHVDSKKIKNKNPTLPKKRFQGQLLQLMDSIDKSNELIYSTSINTYRHETDKGHPTATGHQIWANYIIGKLDKY